MSHIEFPLCRLRDAVSRFVVPSGALCEISTLKAQIELRQLALDDIEVIRCRLRPFMRREGRRLHRNALKRSRGQSRPVHGFRVSRARAFTLEV